MGWDEDTDKVIWGIEFKLKREALHELKQENVFHGLEDVYDLFDRLEVLWAYVAGQVYDGQCSRAGCVNNCCLVLYVALLTPCPSR